MLLNPDMERTYITISAFSDKTLVETARSELDRDIEEGYKFILSLKTRRNALAPISRLPAEMLSEIFVSCASDSQEDFTCSRPSKWIGVTQVCKHWRTISLDCARMWTNLVFSSSSATEEMLRRSKAAPLVIKADGYKPTPLGNVDLALQHLSRTSVLHLQGVSTAMKGLLDRLITPTPLLESLRLRIGPLSKYIVVSLPEPAFDNTTPLLRHVELSNCKFSWGTPLLTGLTHLELRGVAMLPTMTQMLTTFDKMPMLQTLILEDSCPTLPADATSVAKADQIVKLSHLSTLELSSPLLHCTNLLNHICYPPTTTLKLKCDVSQDSTGFFHAISTVTGSAEGAKPLRFLSVEYFCSTVNIRAWTNFCHDPGRTPISTPLFSLHFLCGPHGHRDAESLIATVCKALPITQLRSLFVGGDVLSEKTWLDTFRRSTKLHTLGVNTLLQPSLVSALSNPGGSAKSKTPRILFPQLHALWLDDVSFAPMGDLCEQLQDCLIARSEHGAPVHSIHIHECWDIGEVEIDFLRDLVVDVIWDGIEQFEEDEEDDFDDSEYRSEYDSDPYYHYHGYGIGP